jgi:hypothetical protein
MKHHYSRVLMVVLCAVGLTACGESEPAPASSTDTSNRDAPAPSDNAAPVQDQAASSAPGDSPYTRFDTRRNPYRQPENQAPIVTDTPPPITTVQTKAQTNPPPVPQPTPDNLPDPYNIDRRNTNPAPPTVTPTRSVPTNDSLQQDLAMAFGLPRLITINVEFSRSLLVEAVYQATAYSGAGASGGVTNTGTLVVSQQGVQYSPTPTDKLVVQLGGQTHEFVLTQVQGSMQAPTATEWLMQPHVLQYTHAVAGTGSMEVNGRFDGASFTLQIKGHYTHANRAYALELQSQGRVQGVSDLHGADNSVVYQVTGAVTRDDFRIDVNEQHTSAFVAANNLRLQPSQRGSAGRVTSILNNVLTTGGHTYTLDNIEVVFDTKEKGGNRTSGITSLRGNVTCQGALYGQCAAQNGKAYLQTSTGVMPLEINLTP